MNFYIFFLIFRDFSMIFHAHKYFYDFPWLWELCANRLKKLKKRWNKRLAHKFTLIYLIEHCPIFNPFPTRNSSKSAENAPLNNIQPHCYQVSTSSSDRQKHNIQCCDNSPQLLQTNNKADMANVSRQLQETGGCVTEKADICNWISRFYI